MRKFIVDPQPLSQQPTQDSLKPDKRDYISHDTFENHENFLEFSANFPLNLFALLAAVKPA
jgi:hypothetical protein